VDPRAWLTAQSTDKIPEAKDLHNERRKAKTESCAGEMRMNGTLFARTFPMRLTGFKNPMDASNRRKLVLPVPSYKEQFPKDPLYDKPGYGRKHIELPALVAERYQSPGRVKSKANLTPCEQTRDLKQQYKKRGSSNTDLKTTRPLNNRYTTNYELQFNMLNKHQMCKEFAMNSLAVQINNSNPEIVSSLYKRAHQKHVLEKDPKLWNPIHR